MPFWVVRRRNLSHQREQLRLKRQYALRHQVHPLRYLLHSLRRPHCYGHEKRSGNESQHKSVRNHYTQEGPEKP